MYPGEPDERSTEKRSNTSPRKRGEDVDYVAMPKASRQWASVLLYLWKASYDIKLVDSDGFTQAMSQVKWSIPNPSRSTTIDLFEGPAVDLLRQQSSICDPCTPSSPFFSFLKKTLCDCGLGSSIAKSDLIDHDHEEGTHKGSSKVKQRMCDIRVCTMGWLK
ncbi:La-related protein 6 [Hordeum vulgare]|nr:La-related protein 6 [Hordeum vulgare]